MSKSSRLLLAPLFCLISFAAHAQDPKQQPQKPVEDVVRINTELVQTDVMVFDKDGRFVRGLKKEEFQLLVDGKPQPITFFESVVMGGRNEAAALKSSRGTKGAPPPATENTTDEEVSERGRTILFFVNDLQLEPGSVARTHKLINNFINNQLGPNDQAAITSASGQIGFLQQLTSNRAVLRAAVDRLKFVPGASRDLDRPYMSDYAAYLIKEQNDRQLFQYYVDQTVKVLHIDPVMAASVVDNRAKKIVIWSDATVKNALASLVNLMTATSKLSGRKLVFFISDGFLPNFTGSDFTTMIHRATDSAANGGVVIYSLDARGLSVDPSLEAANPGGFDTTGVLVSRMSGERTFKQEPLHTLAADTGGRALLNSNDLSGGIQRALDETSRYYLLAWRPENAEQRGPKPPKIKITIAGRPDLKVQLRRGFLGAPPEKTAKTAAQPTTVQVEHTDVLGLAESSTEEIRTALSLGYKQTQGNNLQLNSSLQLSAHAPDGGGGMIVTVVIGAVFDSKGKGVGSFKQRIEVPRTRSGAVPVYTYVNHQVDLPPGLYQVRTIAYERGTTRLTNAMEWVELPKLNPGTFSTSSLYIGEIAADGGAGAQVGVNASRRFARSSRLRFTTYIYNAATQSAPQLVVQIKVMRGTEAVISTPEIKVATEKASNLANIPYTGEFPLQSLAPGSYLLDLTVTDKTAGKSVTQQYHFTVY